MVHSCSMHFIISRERKLAHEGAIFVFRSYPDFHYEFQVLNSEGFIVMKKPFDGNLNYEVNADGGYIRWIDIDQDCRIVEVNFEGKRDAALSLKYNLIEVMYELREHKKMNEVVDKDEIAYMRKINAPPLPEVAKSKVVELYKDRTRGIIEGVDGNSVVYGPEEIKGNGYHDICQAKIANFEIAALGSMMETLNISEDSRIRVPTELLSKLTKSGSLMGREGKSTLEASTSMIWTARESSAVRTARSTTKTLAKQDLSKNSYSSHDIGTKSQARYHRDLPRVQAG